MANRGLQAHVSRRRDKPQGEAKAGKLTSLKPPEDEPYDHFPGQDGLAKHYWALYTRTKIVAVLDRLPRSKRASAYTLRGAAPPRYCVIREHRSTRARHATVPTPALTELAIVDCYHDLSPIYSWLFQCTC